jgi:hypothetical protein
LQTQRIFTGVGASQLEAGYHARKQCVTLSTDATNWCRSVSSADCVRQ